MGTAAMTRSERIRNKEHKEIQRALHFDNQWFPIPLAQVREGDYIRFLNDRGRITEGRAQIVDGVVWCDFTAITGRTTARWRDKGAGIERRNLPRLSAQACALMDAIGSLSATQVRMLALFTPEDFSLNNVFDIALERRVPDEWPHVYRVVDTAVRSHMASLRQPGLMNFVAASDAVVAAVIALQYESHFWSDEFAYMTEAARKIEWPESVQFGTLARNKRVNVPA